MSKYKRSGRPQSSRCKRTTRPGLEDLESRLVLSAPTILPLPTPIPNPFAGGGNAVVEGLYHNILGRDADPAGLASCDAQLKAGASVAQLAGQFFQSPEYTTHVVESYYQTYLGRAGDPAGVASWAAQLQAGASEEKVAAAFLSSPEYSAKHVTYSDFVQSLYVNVLGRAGDSAGIASWTQLLGAGTSRGAVVASFIGSPESYQNAIEADYTTFLGRVGDTAGVNSWVAQVQNGSLTLAQVAAQFAGSPEYANRASQETAPATQLVVTTAPPASATANTPFGLTVTAENQYGAVDTTYTGPVTLALSGGTSGAVLGGTVTGTAVNGVATFTGLTINTAGTYTLTASSGTLTAAPVTVAVANAVASPTAIPVISFHGIGTDPANFPTDMPLSTFEADIKALHDAGYHSITLQQYLDWEAGKNPVLPSKPILLTNDDGDVSTMQMTSVLQSDGYTMVAFIVTGLIDNNDDYNVSWAQLQSMVASGTWEVAFHAGTDGHYNHADSNDLPPNQSVVPSAPYFYADFLPGETDPQYQTRVTTELDHGIARLKQMIPTAYTNVFAVPFNDYGQYAPISGENLNPLAQQDLTTIFASRFNLVFVEDNNYPNGVGNNHHQYRFEVHNDTSTSALLAALNDPAFTRFGVPNAVTATQVVVTTPPPASGVTAGVPFSLAVTAEDNAGHVDTTYTGPVMLILNGGGATATLGGTLIVDAVNGTATFSDLTINTAGKGYTISAYSVDLPGWAVTGPITVS